MKILILGATGYIGARLVGAMRSIKWVLPTGAARTPSRARLPIDQIEVNSMDREALARALQGFDAVVNCVAGDYKSIAQGAKALAQAAEASGCRRIVHLSSMAVYGPGEGEVDEAAPLDPNFGWYARAKCAAESHLRNFAERGGELVVLRPGCVFGAGSQLWVGRTGRWLRAGRLGDLGAAGDGWSNLVHVNDVCAAVLAALRLPVGTSHVPVYNLAGPDSPRWNEYFVDLALAIGATPVRTLTLRRLKADAYLAGPPLKVAEKLLARARVRHSWLPDPMPPALVRFWAQQILLKEHAATRELAVPWTGYRASLAECAGWFIKASAVRR